MNKFTKVAINNLDQHNKYWGYKVEDQSNILKMYWGRLGTKGDYNEEKYCDYETAKAMGYKKLYEKFLKGYIEVDELRFDLYNCESLLIGSKHKITKNYFILIRDDQFRTIKDVQDIHEPAAKIGVFIRAINSAEDKTYDIISDSTTSYTIDIENDIWITPGAPKWVAIHNKRLLTADKDYAHNDKNFLHRINTNLPHICTVALQKVNVWHSSGLPSDD